MKEGVLADPYTSPYGTHENIVTWFFFSIPSLQRWAKGLVTYLSTVWRCCNTEMASLKKLADLLLGKWVKPGYSCDNWMAYMGCKCRCSVPLTLQERVPKIEAKNHPSVLSKDFQGSFLKLLVWITCFYIEHANLIASL